MQLRAKRAGLSAMYGCCRLRRRQLCYISLLLCCPMAVMSLLLNFGYTRGGSKLWRQSPSNAAASLRPRPTLPTDADQLARIRNGSVKCGDIQGLFPHRIPPVIHWTNMDNRVLFRHLELLRSWTGILGNSVAYMYWNDTSVEQLLERHYQTVWQQYKRLKVGIMRSDIARLVILHRIGGVYADLDVQLLRSLHPLMLSSVALWSQEPFEHTYFMYNRDRFVSNAIFLTRARHSFLDFVLAKWPYWFNSMWSSISNKLTDPNKAVYITGPVMLNHFFDLYAQLNLTRNPLSLLAHPDMFQPVGDGWFAELKARQACAFEHQLSPIRRQRCVFLKARGFKVNAPTNAPFAIHKFMHTSYSERRNYAKSKLARDILPISQCIV